MDRALRPLICLAAAAILTGPIAATAQEVAADATGADVIVDIEAAPLGVIDRWRAAPDTVFDATEVDLDALQYVARPLIIMANSPNDPMVREQMGYIEIRFSELVARDVMVILDTDPSASSGIREQLRPRGFSMVLIGKDGRVALRKPVPWNVREIVHTIDRLPIRMQEVRDGTIER